MSDSDLHTEGLASLAEAEGLSGHAEAVRIRVEKYSPQIPRPRMVPHWEGLTPAEVVAELDAGDRPEFPVLVEISTEDGAGVAELTVLWTLRPHRR